MKRSDARDWASQREAALLERRYFPQREAARHTVCEAIERYEREVMPQKRPGSIIVQRSKLQWWKTRLGAYALDAVTSVMLLDARTVLAETLAPSTVNDYFSVISHIFTKAVREWQWLQVSPLQYLSKLKEPKGRVRYLSEDELTHLLGACRESRSPHLFLAVVVALGTGARKNEVLSLRWADIDFTRALVAFRITKNGEARQIPLTQHVLVHLRQRAAESSSLYVFPGRSTGHARCLWDSWAVARQRAGLVGFRFHDLRHTAASYLAMSGANLAEIAEVLGHRNIQQTMIYTHLTMTHTRGVVERMNRAVFGE